MLHFTYEWSHIQILIDILPLVLATAANKKTDFVETISMQNISKKSFKIYKVQINMIIQLKTTPILASNKTKNYGLIIKHPNLWLHPIMVEFLSEPAIF